MANSTIGGIGDMVAVPGTLRVGEGLQVSGPVTGIDRSKLDQQDLAVYPLTPEGWKVHDSMDTPLPATPLTDDLGLVGGTFGSGSPSIQTEDLKAAGATTSYARRTISLPPEYVAGQTVTLRVHAGMLTTVAGTSALVDLEVYKSDREAGVDGADLCATAAQSINSLVPADKDFTVTSAALEPGDVLDVRLKVTVTDAATGTAVVALIGAVELLADIKG